MTETRRDLVAPPAHAEAPVWMKRVLVAAGIYNLVWGLGVIAMPVTTLGWIGLGEAAEGLGAKQLWQCIGMIVGVYGFGYLAAAIDPLRHWPIVMVGLLGKIFGPIGFAGGIVNGDLPLQMGWTILTNDLIWWVPFVLILRASYQAFLSRTAGEVVAFEDAIDEALTNTGEGLGAMSEKGALCVLFLRHSGCTFCREALADVADEREGIEAKGMRLVLVHMGEEDEETAAFFGGYGLGDVARVSDPARRLYGAFELGRGSALELFGPTVFWCGIVATLRGHRVGKLNGDGLQMPGVFVLHGRRIVSAYRHKSAADRPDYGAIACAVEA